MSKKPKPGSEQARAEGCCCPVLDNNNGRSAPFPPDNWWISGECPLHAAAPGDGPPKVEKS